MMSIYPTAVGHWLATAHCLFWPFFSSFFFWFVFLKIPGFCTGTRHRGDWRGRRYVLFPLFCLSCSFFLFQLYYLGAAFGGNPGIYQTRYHSVQELFWYHDATMGFGLKIALWKYLEFDITKCKNWITFLALLDLRRLVLYACKHRV